MHRMVCIEIRLFEGIAVCTYKYFEESITSTESPALQLRTSTSKRHNCVHMLKSFVKKD